jgi:hypothetical protein
MVRNSGYCTDIAGWTVIPTVVECDFASKNIPEYLDTLPSQQVIRTIDELNLVGSTHKVSVPGCYIKEETKDGITDMVLHFNMDVNPQGTYSYPGMGSFFNDNTIMKKCSATNICVCKRAPFKTVDSGRCNDKAGWTNIEDRATPSIGNTHDMAGECRKAVEHLSSNSNLLSKSMNMGNSNNPQITGIDPNMGYASHKTNTATIPSVVLIDHMTGTYDIGFKPAGCSIKTDTNNPVYSFNRGTREEIFIMVEYGGNEYARHPYSTNNVDCSAQNQCVCKRVPYYIKVCVSCDGAQSTCLQFQNVDAETLMEIDWNVPGIYSLNIHDQSETVHALVISENLDWKIGTVTYSDTIRSDTPDSVGFTYEYLVKRVPTFITVFAEGSQNDGTAKKCNNVLTVNAEITVEKFTMDKSIPDLNRRVATSGTTCSDFNYDEVSCAGGSCLCVRKEEEMYKEITLGFCEEEKEWLPITSKAECEAVLGLSAYAGYTEVTEGSMRDRPSGCLVFDFTVGSQLIFNTFDTTISQTSAHAMLRSICKRASFNPVSPKKWNDLAQMTLEHIIVPDETNPSNSFEVAVREETNKPIYDDSIVLREFDGNDNNLYNEYRVIDQGTCEDTPGWESLTSQVECQYILGNYEFMTLDITVIISSGNAAPKGCSLQHDITDGITIRFGGPSSSMQCGSKSPSNNVYLFHRCLCKRISNEFANDEMVDSLNKLHGFRPFIDGMPTRDIASPTKSCNGYGCVGLGLPIIDINECDPDPCQNNATCRESGNDSSVELGEYTCDCLPGYNGTNCEEDINECALMDVTPEYELVNYFKTTNGRWAWNTNCREICENAGMTCTREGIKNLMIQDPTDPCRLQIDFFSDLLSIPANEIQCRQCATDPKDFDYNYWPTPNPDSTLRNCYSGGLAQDLTGAIDKYEIIYNTQWNEAEAYDCETKPGNMYEHTAEYRNFVCNCVNFNPIPCKNNATCVESSTNSSILASDYYCACPPRYSGKNCTDFDIDECDPNPCQNGAMCSESGTNSSVELGEYTCDCLPGYNGTNCEEDINECDPDPCQNGATCTQDIGEFTCDCLSGYNGTYCQFDINACEPDPCENGGICNNTIQEKNIYETTQNLPSCNDLVGFDGIITEEDCLAAAEDAEGLYPLESNFAITNINYPTGCLIWRQRTNGAVIWNVNPNAAGVCSQQDECLCKNSEIQRLSHYTCNCTEGFTGENCTVLTLCDPDPCQNGATCTEHSNGTEYFDCECLPGYNGTICDEDINECDPDPCQNGATCTESTNSSVALGEYNCNCPLGFEGFQCHISKPCSLEPCQNNATCTEDVVALTYRIITHQQTCPDLGTGFRGLTADECENYPNTIQMLEYQGGLGNHTYGACAVNEFGGTMIGVIDDNQPSLCFFATCACILPEVEPICDCMLGYGGEYCEYDINACDNQPCQNSAECSSKLIMQDFHMFVEEL